MVVEEGLDLGFCSFDLDCDFDLKCFFVGVFLSRFLIISSSVFLLLEAADILVEVPAFTAAADLELSLDLTVFLEFSSLLVFLGSSSPSESEP